MANCSRRRGAQPGNQNALKHGFYASKYTEADRQDLEACDFTGLVDEVMLLRVYIRRVIEQSANLTEIDDTLNVLRALSLASTRPPGTITRLLRAQRAEFTPRRQRPMKSHSFLFVFLKRIPLRPPLPPAGAPKSGQGLRPSPTEKRCRPGNPSPPCPYLAES